VVLVWLGSYFFHVRTEGPAGVLVTCPFLDLFLGHSEDCFDSNGTDCSFPGGDCRALDPVEFFDLRGNVRAFHSL
jgi:hypothetical protein